MRILLAIGTGSFIGGVCRYLLSQFIQNKFFSTFPFGTKGVSIMGCFIIGQLFNIVRHSLHETPHRQWASS